MSDFFADLMARVDGTAAVLRPRVPSLFETPAAQPQLQPEPAAELAEPATRPSPELSPPPETTREQAPASVNPFRPAEVSPLPPDREAPLRPIGSLRETHETVREIVRTASPPPAAPADIPREPVDAPLHVELARAPAQAPVTDTAHPAPPTSPLPLVSMQTTPAKQAVPPFAPVQSTLRPSLPPRADVSGQKTERTVQISIGRIEIRATSDAPRATSPKPSPVMSLDEYLRSRSR